VIGYDHLLVFTPCSLLPHFSLLPHPSLPPSLSPPSPSLPPSLPPSLLTQVRGLSRDHGAEIFLDKDARKLASKLTKDHTSIAARQKQIKGLQSVTTAYTRVCLLMITVLLCGMLFMHCISLLILSTL